MPSPDPPPAPDYNAIAKTQGVENRDTALFNANVNRVNQYTPDGSVTWSRGTPTAPAAGTAAPATVPAADTTPAAGANPYPSVTYGREGNYDSGLANPNPTAPVNLATQTPATQTSQVPYDDGSGWNQTVTYSPENQRLYDLQQQAKLSYGNTALSALDRASSVMGTPLDTSGIPATNYGGGARLSDGMDQGLMYNYINKDLKQAEAGTAAGGSATAGGNIASTFSQSGVRALPGNIDDTSRRRVEEALLSRIDPSLQRDEEMLRNRLLNSGIEVGTNAYNRELTLSGQHRNDARYGAVLAGGQEESRQVGLQQSLQDQEYRQALATAQYRQAAEAQMSAQQTQTSLANAGFATQASLANSNNATTVSQQNAAAEQARRAQMVQAYSDSTKTNAAINQQNFAQGQDVAGFQNNAGQQELARQIALRQLPLNEANALRTGAQLNAPIFQPYNTSNAAAAPVMDGALAADASAQKAYQTQMTGSNALMGGLATAGAAAIPFLPFSDIRLKKNIQRVGQHPSGVGRYTWDWKDDSGSSYGVLAQELQAIRPEAVVMQPNGFLSVRYDLIGGR